MKILVLILAVAAAATTNNCNAQDKRIYREKGSEFPTLFRSYGGLTVTRAAYERRIVEEVHLSASCASCYGAAYLCGWNNCKWACASEGMLCDGCLVDHSCIQACDACTAY